MNIRGVWLTIDGSNVLFSKDKVTEAIKFLADHNFNTVFPVTWYDGYTLYCSNVMVRYFGEAYKIHPAFISERRDPLREITEVASDYNLAVIPWFEFGFACSFHRDGGYILQQKPEWKGMDQNGNLLWKFDKAWMNAFHPAVQDFMIELLVEVVEEYNVAGIQGDERLPGLPFNGGYDLQTVNDFEQEFGYRPPILSDPSTNKPPMDNGWKKWQNFRAKLLTNFLFRMRNEIKDVNSNLLISVASHVYPWGLEHLLQDTKSWVEKGLIDLIHPQIYRNELDEYKAQINKIVSQFQDYLNIFSPGIAIEIAGENIDNDETEILEAVQYNRNNGIDGEAFFFYEGLRKNQDAVAKALKNGPYR